MFFRQVLLAIIFLQFVAPMCFGQARGKAAIATSGPRVTALAASGDGKLLVSSGTEDVPGQPGMRAVRFWDVSTRKQLRRVLVRAEMVTAIVTRGVSDSQVMYVGDDRGQITTVRADNGQLATFAEPGMAPIQFIRVDYDNGAITYFDDRFHFIDQGERFDAGPNSLPYPDQPLHDFEPIPGGGQLGIANGRDTVLLHPSTFRMSDHIATHRRPVTALAFARGDGIYMATGHDDGTIEQWHAGQERQLNAFLAHRGIVTEILFFDGYKKFVSLGTDGFVRIWDSETAKLLREVKLGREPLLVATLVGRGKILAVGNGTKVVMLTLDPESPKLVTEIEEFDATEQIPGVILPNGDPLKDLADLDNWRIVRGEWKSEEGRLKGAGHSLIRFQQRLPNDLTLRFKLAVRGETNPRVRFDAFHFGYEGRDHKFFLHGPKPTGTPFHFELETEYQIEVQILGDEATLRINGEEVATSNPKRNDSREISIEGGGKQSQGYSEFYDFELKIADQMGQ